MNQQDNLYIRVLKHNHIKKIKKMLVEYINESKECSRKFQNRETPLQTCEKFQPQKKRDGICQEGRQ